MSNTCLAFIPARGGSKRLPNKNLVLFNEKPLIYYTIRAAQKSTCFSRIIVSTDSQEIAEYAKGMGCSTVNRPAELASDFSTTADAAQHALRHLKDKGESFESIATLQPTNPLRTKDLIKNCMDLYCENTDIDSLVTISPNNRKIGVIDRQFFKTKNYTPGQRSQDLREEYFENGLLYISKADMVLNRSELFGIKVKPYIVTHWSGYIDIDEMYEFEMAEFLYKKYHTEFEVE